MPQQPRLGLHLLTRLLGPECGLQSRVLGVQRTHRQLSRTLCRNPLSSSQALSITAALELQPHGISRLTRAGGGPGASQCMRVRQEMMPSTPTLV